MKLLTLVKTGSKEREEGFTLLEYCAGAAIVALVLYAAFNTLGLSIKGFMDNIGTWATARGAEIAASGGTVTQ